MLRWRKIRRNYTNTNGRIVQADNNIALRNHLTGWWFAFRVCGLGLVSEAWSFEKAARASGKFGGVAGVFAGVTSALCWLCEGIAASWKNKLKAVSNCQCAACKSCLAWSLAHPAAITNWFIMACSFNASISTKKGRKNKPLATCFPE